jgi:hypothetical protein
MPLIGFEGDESSEFDIALTFLLPLALQSLRNIKDLEIA